MKSLTSSSTSAIARGISSGLKFSQVRLADSILAAAEGNRLLYGGKTYILPRDVEQRQKFVLELAGKL